MITIRIPGPPPIANSRLGVTVQNGKAIKYRKADVSAWQEVAALCAQGAMRAAGHDAPFAGSLLAMYLVRLANGRRDWDATAKDPGDALNGIVWGDDRQVVGGAMLVDNRAGVDELLVIVADPNKPTEATAFWQLAQATASTIAQKKGTE